MGRLCLAAVLVVLVVLVMAPSARAGCIAAIVVDGVVLVHQDADGWTLPPTEGRRSAVLPACNDAGQNEPDGAITVLPFKGVPADVAVVSSVDSGFYLVGGSLVASAAHPLHRPGRSYTRRGCARGRTLRGTATDAGFDRLMLGDRVIRVDARTRIANRPAYQPVRDGQRLRVTATRCGNRLIADRIAFVGPTIEPVRYERAGVSHDTAFAWGAVALVLLGVVAAGFLFERLTRP
ncbi:hypothetical protein OJ998_25255 [Solirubrobacter taibaiensis]|nr:hypothetical protein [Solirubrobacter taibaiensis]